MLGFDLPLQFCDVPAACVLALVLAGLEHIILLFDQAQPRTDFTKQGRSNTCPSIPIYQLGWSLASLGLCFGLSLLINMNGLFDFLFDCWPIQRNWETVRIHVEGLLHIEKVALRPVFGDVQHMSLWFLCCGSLDGLNTGVAETIWLACSSQVVDYYHLLLAQVLNRLTLSSVTCEDFISVVIY